VIRPEWPAFAVTALVLVCATVLLALHVEVPTWFAYVAVGGTAGGAGLAVPHRGASRADDPKPRSGAR